MGKRRGKVESSEHYAEIVEMLLQYSPKAVSRWLWDTYEESISEKTLRRYLKNLPIEQRMTEKLPSVLLDKDFQQAEAKKEELVDGIADEGIRILKSLIGVGENFAEDYERLKNDRDSSPKQIAEMSLKANEIVLRFLKNNQNSVEVNVDNNSIRREFSDKEIIDVLQKTEHG